MMARNRTRRARTVSRQVQAQNALTMELRRMADRDDSMPTIATPNGWHGWTTIFTDDELQVWERALYASAAGKKKKRAANMANVSHTDKRATCAFR